jgi:hypothetical protein
VDLVFSVLLDTIKLESLVSLTSSKSKTLASRQEQFQIYY